MSMDNNCLYCAKGTKLQELMVKVCDMETSTLYLFKEQTYKGRCVLAFNGHKKELFKLTADEQVKYMRDVCRATKAMQKAFQPDNINYGAFADNLPHFHFHLVPKYEGGPEWYSIFKMSPEPKVLLREEEYAVRVKLIRDCME